MIGFSTLLTVILRVNSHFLLSFCVVGKFLSLNAVFPSLRLTFKAMSIVLLTACLTVLLQFIPMPVLYGVFLYMGVTSLGGVQVKCHVLQVTIKLH